MRMLVFHIACVILFIVPPIFVYNRVYKDGVVGRLFLLGISGTAALFLLDALEGINGVFNPSRLTVAMFVVFAGFLVWHLVRFHRRVMRRDSIKRIRDSKEDRRNTPERRFITN